MASGRGKVILLGEHAVVYGRPALAGALGEGAEANAVPSDGVSTLTIPPWDVHASAGDGSQMGTALAALLGSMGRGSDGVAVTARPAIPGGAGLGCSAALGVAVARAVAECDDQPLSDFALRAAGLAWETVFHGNPSGIDTEMAATGAVGVFVRGRGLSPVALSAPIPVVIGDSGERSSTKDMVASVARERARGPERVEQIFDRIGSLVDDAVPAAQSGDLARLGRLMDRNHEILGSLGLSTRALEVLCEVARRAGAWGCKLTGAGGGGAVVAVASDASAVLEAWSHAGYAGFRSTLGEASA